MTKHRPNSIVCIHTVRGVPTDTNTVSYYTIQCVEQAASVAMQFVAVVASYAQACICTYMYICTCIFRCTVWCNI